jgi:hypothetical protein
MTYQVGGTVRASDYNGWVTTNTNNFNGVWGTGTGNSGYGQTDIISSPTGLISGGPGTQNKITAGTSSSQPYWYELLTKITKAAAHQGSSISPQVVPVRGDKITYVAALTNNLNTINTNRLNAAGQSADISTTATNTVLWNNALTFTATATFSSHNNARYFFNSGGQIGVQSSHSNTTNINQVVNLLAVNMGTIWFSSPIGTNTATINGSSWTGVTRISNPLQQASTITQNSTWGFYNWNSTETQVFRVEEDTYYYHAYGNDSYAAVYVSYNGSGVVTIKVQFDLKPDVPTPPSVVTGTTATLIVRPPSTTNLVNTWGTPAVTWAISTL